MIKKPDIVIHNQSQWLPNTSIILNCVNFLQKYNMSITFAEIPSKQIISTKRNNNITSEKMSKLQGVWLEEYFYLIVPEASNWSWYGDLATSEDGLFVCTLWQVSVCRLFVEKYSGGSSTKCSLHGQSATSDKSRLFRCFDKQYHVKERANLDQSIWPGEEIKYPIGKLNQVLL